MFATILLIALSVLPILSLELGVFALCVLLPLSASAIFPRSMWGVVGLNPFNALFIATCAAVTVRMVRGRRGWPLQWPRIFIAYIFLLVLLGILGIYHCGDIPEWLGSGQGKLSPNQITVYAREFAIKPFIIIGVCLLAAQYTSQGHYRSLLYAPIVGSTAIAAILIGYFVSSGLTLDYLSQSTSRGAFSWFGMHANELGLLLSTGLAISLSRATAEAQTAQRLFLLAASAAQLVATIITFSRGAYIGVAVIVLYYIILERRVTLKAGALFLVFVGTVLTPAAVISRALTGMSSGSADLVTAGRLNHLWLPLLSELSENPFAARGLGSIMWSEKMRSGQILPANHPHNAYLAAALDAGVIGAVVLIAFWLHLSLWLRRCSKSAQSLEHSISATLNGASIACAVFLVQGFTDNLLTPTYPQSWIWVVLGVAAGSSAAIAQTNPKRLNRVEIGRRASPPPKSAGSA